MNQGTRGFAADESGAIAIVMALFLAFLMGLGAMTFDFGYMWVVQGDLKKAAEAGALVGVDALAAGDQGWEDKAKGIIEQNSAGGKLLTDGEVEAVDSGYWSLKQQQWVGANPDKSETPAPVQAVRVNLVKEANSIPLFFAPIVGINHPTSGVRATAVAVTTATVSPPGGWGILETGDGDVSITGAVASNGSVGVNGKGNVKVSGSGSITGSLYVNGNANVTLSGTADIDGSAWDKGSGKFAMKGSAAVDKVAYLDNAVTQSYEWSTSINGHQYQGGNGFQKGDIIPDASGASVVQSATQEALTAYNTYYSSTPTPAVQAQVTNNKINLTGIATKTITGTGGITNVLSLTSLSVGNSAILTLNAPATAKFVIDVSGNITFNGAGQVVLQGGLTYDNVTFVYKGPNNSGTEVTLGGSAIISGNILSPNGDISLGGSATYSGSLVGGQKITLSGSVHTPNQIPWIKTYPSGSSSNGHGAHLVK